MVVRFVLYPGSVIMGAELYIITTMGVKRILYQVFNHHHYFMKILKHKYRA